MDKKEFENEFLSKDDYRRIPVVNFHSVVGYEQCLKKSYFTHKKRKRKKLKKKIKLKDLTKEQYKKWLDKHCNPSYCKKCIFGNIFCQLDSGCCWIDHKNCCSKKFLNKKIRIEKEIKNDKRRN